MKGAQLLRPACRRSLTRALARPHRPFSGTVEVSQDRLEQFLRAEIAYLGQGSFSTIGLRRILQNTTPESAADLISKELPQCFATRIRQIEDLTPEWKNVPGLQEIHDILLVSFRNLRMANLDSGSEPAKFTEIIRDLRERHKPMVPLFAGAARSLRESGCCEFSKIDSWLGTVMRSRMGTEMLTAHYMSLLTDPDENHIGIVDTKCDPARICADAIAHVKSQFTDDLSISLRVEQPDIEFSFVSKYLFFVVEELLRNSACATLSRARKTGDPPREIHILVCEDPRRIGIKISDEGGGIPVGQRDKIWEFMFSTTPTEFESHFTETTPLSGSGMGLPLCRLYTTYLGGSLHVMSMPGVGTDAYMYLNRIDAMGEGIESGGETE